MKFGIITLKKIVEITFIFSAIFSTNAAAKLANNATSDEALHALTYDIIVRAKTDNNLRERVASVLTDSTIIGLPDKALSQAVKGLQITIHDHVCKTLTEIERRDIIGRKFHELLNPTKENAHYNITHYTEMVKHICERTNQPQFTQQHASFTEKLSTCAQKALKGGLMYLMTGFSKDLLAAFDCLGDPITKKVVSGIVSNEMAKKGQGGILIVVRSRNKK